jgi:spermidine/putrescine transport system permease protein
MILPIMTNVERLDDRLVDAARDLGANRFTTFSKVIIPLTMPGIIAGCILVFLPAMTIFYITDILGGAKSILLGNLIQNQFLIAQNWPMGSALSTVLTLLLISLILIYLWSSRGSKKREWL